VTALDAYALVAFLADEPARDEVEALLRESCVVTTVNLAESLDVVERVYGIGEDELRALLDPLLADTLAIDSPTSEDAWVASSLRRRYYARPESELSLADCFLLAAAIRSSTSVATTDPAVASAARAEALTLVPLPDSAGRRPLT
jgi:PIN domain nuclease of toxin-antitoxin system